MLFETFYALLFIGCIKTTLVGRQIGLGIYDDAFGKCRIDKVKTMDAKAWLVKLQQEDGRGFSSIHTIRGVLRPAFAMAVEDDLIAKNPFDFMLCDVIVNDNHSIYITHDSKTILLFVYIGCLPPYPLYTRNIRLLFF